MAKFDFSGWATKNNLRCSDGRTIIKDAFKENDGKIVPLVWNHQHNDPNNVLGHALLENREDGVYAYCTFNESEAGKTAKELVTHGDVSSLSIFANKLKQQGSNVIHGAIREVSLVLAGANPGALIDSVISHGEESDEEATIYTGEPVSIAHADSNTDSNKEEENLEKQDDKKDKTVKEVFDTLNEEQKTVVYAMIGQALEDAGKGENQGGNDDMKHNVFDQEQNQENTLSHAEMATIIADGKRYGSLRESVLQHAQDYGIENIGYLFPDAKNVNQTPEFIKRDMGWVARVMGMVHHTPFSRIKTIFADITEDEARAKGYIKGKLKKEEVFSLLKRTTDPTTVYKKQKLDRDDVVDITDFEVVAWLKGEMRMMLDEEIARAVLVGDGRLSSDDDKIDEGRIRPIWKDAELYSVNAEVKVANGATDDDKAKEFIKACIKSRKNYKGSGNPTMFMTEDMLAACLLLTDAQGRDLYETEEQLAKKLRVKEIITVPVMENLKREVSGVERELAGIYVNLNDYNIGADKGGSVNMFDDFDIDYNAQKYLIETRCSGALVKPYSAVVLEFVKTV